MLRTPWRSWLLVLAFAVAVVPLSARGVAFSLDTDGATFATLGGPSGPVTFNPNRSSSTTGTSLTLGGSTSGKEFFTVDVLDDNVLTDGSDFDFSAEVRLESVAPGDLATDALFGLTDGDRFFGGGVSNPDEGPPFFGPNTDRFVGEATTGPNLDALALSDAAFNVADNDMTITVRIDVSPDDTTGRTVATLFFVTNDSAGTGVTNSVTSASEMFDLDPSQGLSFVVASDVLGQSFRFDEISIDFVPEPGAAAAMLGVGGMLLRGRRRR
ncbi:MAG: PEP-CTERM sorting domain-containing protein [Planctomycetota bacterium]